MFDSYQQRVPKLIVPYNDAKGEIHWFTIIFPIKIEKLIDLRDIGNTVYIYIYISVYIYISSVYFIFRHTCMVSFQGMLVCPLYFPFGTCRASAKESFSGNAFCTMIATVSRVAWERVGTLPLPIIIWYYLLSSGLCISQNRLVIYICIVPGPAEVNSEETFSTLQYAKRAGVAKGLQGTPKDPWLLG